ncbi:EscU/YscU/HrcU family type III secretion system export apparatus switch protein [Clostridium sp. D2Q-14]|uniref:EscU/YscU/HrcU family type III secretion system export apparatus switch protein n=1 Tax=Anaeromonas gelatinilytica TaxID=2683194 RepID=UPI00193B741C|nr:EscU/YscU/HrcU family type III secretion system export apparatus switch protein [Anaeromonas gelatinilytica]
MKDKDIAIALKYKSDKDIAPKVIAKGKGIVATKIINKSKDEDIYVYKDEDLVNKLYSIELGNEIPFELYETIAGILAFVYEVDKKKGLDEKGE